MGEYLAYSVLTIPMNKDVVADFPWIGVKNSQIGLFSKVNKTPLHYKSL